MVQWEKCMKILMGKVLVDNALQRYCYTKSKTFFYLPTKAVSSRQLAGKIDQCQDYCNVFFGSISQTFCVSIYHNPKY